LDTFQPHFDEVVMVRATGWQVESDKTLAIAKQRGCITAEYWNDPANKWPHVDDFSAARNMAFDMATGDFVMWADTDDLIDADSIAAIRAACENLPEGFAGIEMPYEVPEDGLTVFRERIIRRGAARWESPIHEHLVFKPGAKVHRLTGAKILHMPSGGRAPNNERNLRILESIPENKRTTSHKFHLFQSLRAVGRIEEAGELCVAMLRDQSLELGQPEKYELFVAAGQLADDERIRSQMMLQALATDPKRPEAYGELARCEVAAGRDKEALAWTTAMRQIAKTSSREWNSRMKYHGWLGEFLHAMALRACNRIQEADTTQANHFIRSGAKISLLHATRGRPAKAAAAQQIWLNRAADPDAVEHIFGLDANDETSIFLNVFNHVYVSGADGPVAAWNACAAKSQGQNLVQLSDDWNPPMHWDRLIIEAIGDTAKPAVLAVSDGHRKDDLLCMAILTRARYQSQGYLFHPEFFSMFSDNHFSQCAFTDGVVIDARDRITFEHMHPAFGKSEMDETYARSNDQFHYLTGRGIWDRIREGIRVSTDVEGWCDYKDLYSHIAKVLPDGAEVVEIGCWMGQSIIHFCQRLQDIGKKATVHCVDTWKGEENQPAHLEIVSAHGGSIFNKFQDNCMESEVIGMISPIIGDSAESAERFEDASLDFIFIDAAHDYNSVVKDLAAWWPKLKPDGIFAGHDYPWHEVKKAVDEHAAANGYEVAQFGRCWVKINEKP
jgi:predicted O-methyltransferase YrrM